MDVLESLDKRVAHMEAERAKANEMGREFAGLMLIRTKSSDREIRRMAEEFARLYGIERE